MPESLIIPGYNNRLLGAILAVCASTLIFLGGYGAWQIFNEGRLVGLMRAITGNFLISLAICFSFLLGAILTLTSAVIIIQSYRSRNLQLLLNDNGLQLYDDRFSTSQPSGQIPWSNIKAVDYQRGDKAVLLTLADPNAEGTYWHRANPITNTSHESQIRIENQFSKTTLWITNRIRERANS